MNTVKMLLVTMAIISLSLLTCQGSEEAEKEKKAEQDTNLLLLGIANTPNTATPSSCNTSGIAQGCTSSAPYSCSAISTCYGSLASCRADARCFQTSTSTSTSTISVLYINQPQNGYFLVNSAITATTPITSGGSGNGTFTISPSLPSGLNINSSTGQITGTPTVTTASTSYTVTAQYANGTTTATVSFHIVSSLSNYTCNTSGIATGCSAASPFSCTNATTCFTSNSLCVSNSSCAL